MSGMLPEYELPFSALFSQALDFLAPVHAPLLADIRKVRVDHLSSGSLRNAHGVSTDSERLKIGSEIKTISLVETDLDEWYKFIGTTSEQLARRQMQMLLSAVERTSHIAGNTVGLRGAPLSHDAMLDVLDRVEFEVDENGQPVGVTFVVPPGVQEQLARLGPMTPEQQQRYQNIIAAKKRLQDAKKRIRKLDQRSR